MYQKTLLKIGLLSVFLSVIAVNQGAAADGAEKANLKVNSADVISLLDQAVESGEVDLGYSEYVYDDSAPLIAEDYQEYKPIIGLTDDGETPETRASCAQSTLFCALTAGGGLLACMGTAESLGILTWPCYSLSVAAGNFCWNAANDCPVGNVSLPTSQTSRAGSSHNLRETLLTCGGQERAWRVRFYSDDHPSSSIGNVVSRLILYCTDGSTRSFVGNNGVGYRTTSCGTGYLLQGLRVRSGSAIDAAGVVCDKVGEGSSNDLFGPLNGGPGGSQRDLLCPETKYVYGLRTWHDDTLPSGSRYVAGLEVLCR